MDYLTENLRLLRKKVWNESQAVFGSRLGIERTTYARIETGGYNLSLETALAISRLTGISVEDLTQKRLEAHDFPNRPIGEGGQPVLREPKDEYKKKEPSSAMDLMDIRKLVEVVQNLQKENEKMKERITFLENKLREREKPF